MAEEFLEGFEIAIQVPEQFWDRESESDDPTSEYVDSVKVDASELGFSTNEILHETRETGWGAGIPTLILIFSGLTALFFSAKKIEENLDSWIRLARRFTSAFRKLSDRGRVYLSDAAAVTLALSRILTEIPEIKHLEMVAVHKFPIAAGGWYEDKGTQFRVNPGRSYLFVIKINRERVYVICIKSTGEVEVWYSFSVDDWLEFHGVR
jgi:hypothetical protein